MELKTQVVGPLRYLNPTNIASYSDVKLISAEGECFYTNRLVLSSASQMFHTTFQEIDLITSAAEEDAILVITEYCSAHLRNVIDFITRGIVFLSSDTDCAAEKGGLITNRQLLSDFSDFGIDLSTLLMIPVEDVYLEKLFNFDKESDVLYPVDLNDIKLEQMERLVYQPELEVSEDEIPLKHRSSRPRGSANNKRTIEKLKLKHKLKGKTKKLKESKKLKLKIKYLKGKPSEGNADTEDMGAIEEEEVKENESGKVVSIGLFLSRFLLFCTMECITKYLRRSKVLETKTYSQRLSMML